jgi:hypothetical protein
MKISKSRIAVLVLLAVTVAYAVAFYCSFQAHNQAFEKRLQEIPLYARPYVDGPFWSTATAKTFGICLYPLILGWIGLFLFGNKLDRKINGNKAGI